MERTQKLEKDLIVANGKICMLENSLAEQVKERHRIYERLLQCDNKLKQSNLLITDLKACLTHNNIFF